MSVPDDKISQFKLPVEFNFKLQGTSACIKDEVKINPVENDLTNNNIIDPVKWNFSSKKLSDCEYELSFKAKIEGNYHLYGQMVDLK